MTSHACQQLLILDKQLLGIEGQVQPAEQLRQGLLAAEHPEEIDQIAVEVVDDFFLRGALPQENLRAAHAGFNVDTVGRHEG